MTLANRPSWREPPSTVVIDVRLQGVDIHKATEKWRSKIGKRKHPVTPPAQAAPPTVPVTLGSGQSEDGPPPEDHASLDITL